jgi:diguanylate cyclase (GGDEF)-like protein/PAS domain S-box-containing protein
MAKDSTERSASTAIPRIGSMQQHGETLEKLAFSNILLTAVIESSPDGILVANNINKILTYNNRFLEMWNISPEDEHSGINEKLLLRKAQALKDPERYVENIRLQHANSNKDSRYETEFKDGRVFEESTTVLRNQDEYIGRIWFYHEITKIREATQTLTESEQRLKTILDTAVDGILIVDCQSRQFVQGNRAIMNMLGYGADELSALCLDDIHPIEALTETQQLFQKCADGEPITGKDVPIKRRDGSVFFGDITAAIMHLAGRPYFVCNIRDISARKVAEQRIIQLARTDQLTDLPNRRVFNEALKQAIDRAGRDGQIFAVLYLDLDNFKDVNDTLGHTVGDELLVMMSKRLLNSVRAGDVVARFGGDEFAVLQTGIQDPSDAAILATKVIEALSHPFLIHENKIQSSTSVGIAVSDPETNDSEVLLSHADLALYEAKSNRRGTYHFFAESMDTEVRERVKLVSELRRAIAEGEMLLHYQPQIDARNGRLIGLEALVRWNHPERGLLLPGSFIGIAETSGMIVSLGKWVQIEACRQMRDWLDAGIAPPVLAINLSAVEFKTAGIEEQIIGTIKKYDVPRDRIELELTESTMMELSKRSNDVLVRFRKQGIRISIDDFGTGYSSLAYLKRFRPNRIKIAGVFVSDMLEDEANRAVVQSIIGIARALNIEVIAEGVETAAQAKFLCELHCCEVQGFAFSRARSAADITQILRRKKVFALIDRSALTEVA